MKPYHATCRSIRYIRISAAEVNQAERELVGARIRLVKARYEQATCIVGLTNGGRGDKCTTLALEHNALEDARPGGPASCASWTPG
jgi:hypothetical protein